MNTIEEVNFLMGKLVDFTDQNNYVHTIYKSYAKDFCTSFNRLYSQLSESEQKEILQKINEDFYLEVARIVDKFNERPDYQIKQLENNYRQMKNLILNGIKTEPKHLDNIQQSNEDKPDEISNKIENPYPHIFKNNAFEVWQSMFDSFGINESSRTDVKFIFEEMKKDGLIFETVNQKTFLDWISQTYEIVVQKISNHSKSPERISIYSNAKQLYKA